MGEIRKTIDSVRNTIYGNFDVTVLLEGETYMIPAEKIVQEEKLIDNEFGSSKLVSLYLYESQDSGSPSCSIKYAVQGKQIPQVDHLEIIEDKDGGVASDNKNLSSFG